jgi:hypothetical protein
VVVDGGMVSLEVTGKAGPDVVARVVDPGLILSRANLVLRRRGKTVRARNAHLPVISAKVRTAGLGRASCCARHAAFGRQRARLAFTAGWAHRGALSCPAGA